ncbi:MAG: dihydrofolate reductase [Treponema sp.]|nr:dihydrofolate reductase [Treponema sp.]
MKEQDIILIVAMAENRVIGKDNAMPWSIKGNLAHFKEKTMGWPCIMGRKTWDSLPIKPLPGRLNIILSKSIKINGQQLCASAPLRDKNSDNSGIKVFSSLESAIESCANYEKVFICGGESIYKQAMPLATKIDLTLIPGLYDGDTFFPEIDETKWKKTDTVDYDNFKIITYEKEKS